MARSKSTKGRITTIAAAIATRHRYGRRVVVIAAAAQCLVAACGGDDSNHVRGRGLEIASLPAADRARIYEAAARGSFDVDNTSLLLDRRYLPRVAGLADSGRVDDALVTELRRRGTIKGVCEPPLTGVRGNPQCTAQYPGYVLRYSPVFTIRRDSVQVYMYAQQYETPSSGRSPTLRFERAYQIARRGDGWKAVREGHVPKEVRGER